MEVFEGSHIEAHSVNIGYVILPIEEDDSCRLLLQGEIDLCKSMMDTCPSTLDIQHQQNNRVEADHRQTGYEGRNEKRGIGSEE